MDRSDPPPLAVISGGTSGIGLAVARRLMKDGYEVLLTGRDMSRGQSAVAQLRTEFPENAAEFAPVDSGRWSDYGRLVGVLNGRPVSVIVASAAFGVQARVTETDPETLLRMMAVNVAGPLHLIQVLRPFMVQPASVVLISSDAGIDGEQALGAYSVTKAAVNMLGRMMALDLAPDQIRVNVVCPGDTVPGMRYLLRPGEQERSSDDYKAWPMPPRGRLGEAEDTANLVAFLVSPDADFMVGTVTLVDGGSRAGRPEARPGKR